MRFTPYLILSLASLSSVLVAGEAPTEPIIGDAILQAWTSPECPAQLRKEKRSGWAYVEFVVDAAGKVTDARCLDSSDPLFAEPAIVCVRTWSFTPAEDVGGKIPSAMRIRVIFDPARKNDRPFNDLPLPVEKTPAVSTYAPTAAYPSELESSRMNGGVVVRYTITAEGTVADLKVLQTSDVAFVRPTLDAVARWRFTPVKQGPIAIPSMMTSVVRLDSLGAENRADILRANHISAAEGKSIDTLPGWPEPLTLWEPAVPRTLLLADTTGETVVEFTINESGKTQDITTVSTSAPELGEAVQSAIESWLFEPALQEGAAVPVRMRYTYRIEPATEGPEARLLALLKTPDGIANAKGLDQKIRPIWRSQPIYPTTLRSNNPTGSAEVEIIIDREGRVRLPQVIAASHPAFGWAAATAVQQWLFTPPTRGGQPVDVRIRVPFTFTPPAH